MNVGMSRLAVVVMLFVVFAACSCRSRDDRAAVVHVPEMKNEAAAGVVRYALMRTPGVAQESIQIDVARRRVTLKYDSLNMSLKNVEFAIVMAGFQANDIPADEAARKALPADVREDRIPPAILQPETVSAPVLKRVPELVPDAIPTTNTPSATGAPAAP